MSISLTCTCGRRLKVPEEHAGKRAKCPHCGDKVQIPDGDVVDSGFEVVDDGPPAKTDRPSTGSRASESDRRPPAGAASRKKKKGPNPRRRKGSGSSLAQMYASQGAAWDRRDDIRARGAGAWGGDGEGGLTIWRVHITAGVLSGVGMMLAGLFAMAVIGIFRHDLVYTPRLFVGAIACTSIGAIVLAKAVLFGEED